MTNAAAAATSRGVAARCRRDTPRAFLAFPSSIPSRPWADPLPGPGQARPAWPSGARALIPVYPGPAAAASRALSPQITARWLSGLLHPFRLPVRGVMADGQRPARTRTIRVTLVGLLLVPLLALVGLWAFAASITLGNVIRYQHYTTLAHRTSASIGALTGDLAAERSLTLAWVGSGRRISADVAAGRAPRHRHGRRGEPHGAGLDARTVRPGRPLGAQALPGRPGQPCPGSGRRPTRERPASSPPTAPTTRSARLCGSSSTSRRRPPTPPSAP